MIAFEGLSKSLSSVVLSDIMDEHGLTTRAMRPFVRPVEDGLGLVGRDRTGLFVDRYSVGGEANPYEMETARLDDLKPGDVAVLACNGPTERIAPWGELLTTAAIACGAAGCVTDGLVRDMRQIQELGFPVFHGGISPLDTRGQAHMIAMDRPIECAGVKIEAGDFVFGDIDGVVAIPQQHVSAVVEGALEKVRNESHTRDELRKGSLLSEVFERYGVL